MGKKEQDSSTIKGVFPGLSPKEHAFTKHDRDDRTCYWCGENIADHKTAVVIENGQRSVEEALTAICQEA